MPVTVLIIRRIPSVLDTPRRLHSAGNASHSSLSILPARRFGSAASSAQPGPQWLALRLLLGGRPWLAGLLCNLHIKCRQVWADYRTKHPRSG